MIYRETAEKITEMTGQSISAMGVWNVIQALGEKVCEDEQKLVKAHKAGQVKGDRKNRKRYTHGRSYKKESRDICDRQYLMSAKHEFSTATRSN